jgi:hypothetical protein
MWSIFLMLHDGPVYMAACMRSSRSKTHKPWSWTCLWHCLPHWPRHQGDAAAQSINCGESGAWREGIRRGRKESAGVGWSERVPRTGGNRSGSTGSPSYRSSPVRNMTGNRSLTGPKKPGQTEPSGVPAGLPGFPFGFFEPCKPDRVGNPEWDWPV